MRTAVGIFDVSHLGKVMVSGPGAAALRQRRLTNDLGRIGPGQAQYTLCCDAETGGIVDDLIAYYQSDEQVLLVPNAANTAEVVRRLRAAGARGRRRHRPPPRLRRARRAGHPLRRGARRAWGCRPGTTTCASRRARFDGVGVVVCRTGYTGERGYELIVENDTAPAAVGRAARRRRAVRHRALRPRRPRHPAHRDGLPAARAGHLASTSRPTRPASAGRSAGSKDAFWGKEALVAEKEARAAAPAASPCASTGRGIPRPHMSVSLTPDVLLGEITSGTFSPTLQEGHRAGAAVDRGRPGGPGRRRRPRAARDVPDRQAALRRHLGA